jgi:hypothetical protein
MTKSVSRNIVLSRRGHPFVGKPVTQLIDDGVEAVGAKAIAKRENKMVEQGRVDDVDSAVPVFRISCKQSALRCPVVWGWPRA